MLDKCDLIATICNQKGGNNPATNISFKEQILKINKLGAKDELYIRTIYGILKPQPHLRYIFTYQTKI